MKAMLLVAGALALSAVTLKAGLLPAVGASATAATVETARGCPPLLDHTFPGLQDEKPRSMCQYAGKVVLVVNTASFCGYTSQYEGLESLYDKYKARGLVVVGFPSNDFGNQEPGSNKEIADFCRLTYGVQFPMFAKIDVNGDDTHPLYRWLKTEKSGLLGGRIKWNFTKFLVGRDGQVIERFAPTTTPADLEKDVVAALAAPRP